MIQQFICFRIQFQKWVESGVSNSYRQETIVRFVIIWPADLSSMQATSQGRCSLLTQNTQLKTRQEAQKEKWVPFSYGEARVA